MKFAVNIKRCHYDVFVAGSGGICEKYKPYTNKDKQIWKSLNTGVVSIVNYNKRVPQRVSELTFAHEVGHSLGSPVDLNIKQLFHCKCSIIGVIV